jgi:hypothetical protein
MIKKFNKFISENNNHELSQEIEQRIVILDDNDIDYQIYNYIEITSDKNSYKLVLDIHFKQKINHTLIGPFVRYFEKYYTVIKSNYKIKIIEIRKLKKDELLKMILSDEHIAKIEDFSKDIFSKLKQKNTNFDIKWEINDNEVIVYNKLTKKIIFSYDIWWKFFDDLNIEYYKIKSISKALIDENFNISIILSIDYYI